METNRITKTDKHSSLYRAGYAAGYAARPRISALTPEERRRVAMEWIWEQREQLSARAAELQSEIDDVDNQITVHRAAGELRSRGFEFPFALSRELTGSMSAAISLSPRPTTNQ